MGKEIDSDVVDVLLRLLRREKITPDERARATAALEPKKRGRPLRSFAKQHSDEFGRAVAYAAAIANESTVRTRMKTATAAANTSRKRVQEATKALLRSSGNTLDQLVDLLKWDRSMANRFQAGGIDALRPFDVFALAVHGAFSKALVESMTEEQVAELKVGHAKKLGRSYGAVLELAYNTLDAAHRLAEERVRNGTHQARVPSNTEFAAFVEGVAYRAAKAEMDALTRAINRS